MKYIYISAGRKYWFDLANELRSQFGYEPALWCGDLRHISLHKEKFRGCNFVNLDSTDISPYATETLESVLCSTDFHWIKDEAIKMMDRLDSHDLWGRKHRETLFYRKLIEACCLIESAKPDFMLLSESPHNVLTYLIWRACRIIEIPCLHFEAASIAPALVMVSSDASSLNKVARFPEIEDQRLEIIYRDVKEYLKRFESGEQPTYMTFQKNKEKVHENIKRQFKDMLLRLYPLGFAIQCELHGTKKRTALARHRLKLWGRGKVDKLRDSYALVASSEFVDKKFVYFPLHYEPERTTSPDGGKYYDQVRAVLELRTRLPESLTLVVKEHPSQHYKNMKGFKGRDSSLFILLSEIDGIFVAPQEITSSELIDKCCGLITVTGTAALEAVLVRKPAIVLGNAWFAGIPGLYTTDEFSEFFDACMGLNRDLADARAWLIEYFSNYALFGCVNPSNERNNTTCSNILATQSASPLAHQINGFLRKHNGAGQRL